MILFQFSILDSEEPLPGNLPGTGLQLSERALNGGKQSARRCERQALKNQDAEFAVGAARGARLRPECRSTTAQ
jgi:hypothetical protein